MIGNRNKEPRILAQLGFRAIVDVAEMHGRVVDTSRLTIVIRFVERMFQLLGWDKSSL